MNVRPKITCLVIVSIFILCVPFRVVSQEVSEKTALTGALHYAQEVFGPLVHLHTQIFRDLSNTAQVYIFLFCHPEASNRYGERKVSSDIFDQFDETVTVTVVAGANKTHVPVIQMYQGLPDYILHMEEMERFLSQKTSKEGWFVTHYVYVSPFEFWLEWRSPKYPKPFLIRSSDLQVMDEDLLPWIQDNMKRSRCVLSNNQRDEKIRKKWEFVESLCNNRFGGND